MNEKQINKKQLHCYINNNDTVFIYYFRDL